MRREMLKRVFWGIFTLWFGFFLSFLNLFSFISQKNTNFFVDTANAQNVDCNQLSRNITDNNTNISHMADSERFSELPLDQQQSYLNAMKVVHVSTEDLLTNYALNGCGDRATFENYKNTHNELANKANSLAGSRLSGSSQLQQFTKDYDVLKTEGQNTGETAECDKLFREAEKNIGENETDLNYIKTNVNNDPNQSNTIAVNMIKAMHKKDAEFSKILKELQIKCPNYKTEEIKQLRDRNTDLFNEIVKLAESINTPNTVKEVLRNTWVLGSVLNFFDKYFKQCEVRLNVATFLESYLIPTCGLLVIINNGLLEAITWILEKFGSGDSPANNKD